MDESVEVGKRIGVQIIDDVNGILGCNALVPLYFVGFDAFQFMEKQLTLHEVVILGEVAQLSLDIAVLLGHQLIQSLLHLVQHHH